MAQASSFQTHERPTSSENAKHRHLPGWIYQAMLLGSAVIWGGSFVALKGALDVVSPAWLMAIRFLLSGAIFVLIFHRRLARYLDGSHILAGILLGAISAIGFVIENAGLTDTTPSNNAFLTATYVVMVPFLVWIFMRRRPKASNILAAVLTLVGIAFVSMGSQFVLALRWGDLMTLLSAVFFAGQIVLLSMLGSKHDTLVLTTVELLATGVFSLIIALITEPIPRFTFTPDFMFQLGYVVLLASCASTVMQNVGQKHVLPAQASLLLCLESVFGVLFSVIFYGDPLTPQLLAGFVLIFCAIVLSEVSPKEFLRLLIPSRQSN